MKKIKHCAVILTLSAMVVLGCASNLKKPVLKPSVTAHPSSSSQKSLPSDKIQKSAGNTATHAVSTPKEDRGIADNAPKLATVRSQVKVERTYHTLKTANDPMYSTSWALQKVNAPTAWDIATGNDQTTVAVIDTGFALNHVDLSGSWKINSGEFGTTQVGGRCWTGVPLAKQTNNCDDDNNGYNDDWRGWNFTISTNSPQAGELNPQGQGVSHGTEVAGLIGARGNNSFGIATINWNTRLMPLQALSDDGVGYTSDVAAAIYYAVDNGANVINMSLGGDQFDQYISSAIEYAYQHNVVVVAAAGNCGTGNEQGCNPAKPGELAYPATENHVISVGATNQSDQAASFSSNGPGLDVVAPGSGAIVSPMWSSTNQTSAYSSSLYGTSFSAPQVSSLASLIKSIRPSTTVDDITSLILASTSKPSAMNSQVFTPNYGHGIINAQKSLQVAASLNATANSVPSLRQTGGYSSEHTYQDSETLSSGCEAPAGTYCSIWLKDATNGYDRYLPYTATNGASQAGWLWNSAALGSATWNVRAVQGQSISTTPYQLLNK